MPGGRALAPAGTHASQKPWQALRKTVGNTFTRIAHLGIALPTDTNHVSPTLLATGRTHKRTECECGHDRLAHQHYRSGTDCSGCACERYAKRRRIIDLRIHL